MIENGVLTGMEFDKFRSTETDGQLKQEVIGREIIPCDTVVLAIGQDNSFPWIERDIGLDFGKWDMPVVDKTTFMSTRPGVFFGGDAAFGPANIIWAVEHGHQAAISIHNYCQGVPVTERPADGMTLTSTKMGLHEWAYDNDYDGSKRQKMVHVDLVARFKSLNTEVEIGFSPEQTAAEVQRCLNCDIQTHFTDSLCIECDACLDICPVDCLSIVPNGDEADLRGRLAAPALEPRSGAVRVRVVEADRARDGEGRERLRALRPVRRAVPHLRLGHAQVRDRHPLRRQRQPWWVSSVKPNQHESRQRLRVQDRHRQRHRLGVGQRPDHAGHLPHGRAGDGQERLPLEHPGPADVVRDPGQQARLLRAHARVRPDGGAERRDLRRRTSPRCAPAAGCSTTRRGRSTTSCGGPTSPTWACPWPRCATPPSRACASAS